LLSFEMWVAPVVQSGASVIHRQLDLSSGPDVYGLALVEELEARGYDFDLQMQLWALSRSISGCAPHLCPVSEMRRTRNHPITAQARYGRRSGDAVHE
jgi:hypothetical protein